MWQYLTETVVIILAANPTIKRTLKGAYPEFFYVRIWLNASLYKEPELLSLFTVNY